MAAYFILTQTVTDQRAYTEDYVPGVLPFLQKHGGELLAFTFEAERLEGNPAEGVVVLRFPSEQAVRDFVSDPGYAPFKQLRFRITTDANAILVPEWAPPDSRS